MRWLALFALLSVSPACSRTATPTEADQPGAKQVKQGDKAARKGPRPGQKGAPQKGAKRPGGKDGKARPAPKVFGAAGKVVGKLQLEPAKVEGKTAARLELTSADGKQETVALGAIHGTCVDKEPAVVNDVTALWTVACTSERGSADISIAQQGQALLVARLGAGASTYKPVRRVRLAKDAEVVRDGAAGAAAAKPAPAPEVAEPAAEGTPEAG